MAASFILKSLYRFINYINYFAVNCIASFVNCSIQFRSCLQTNGVIESDVEEVIKKQLDNAPKPKDDEKTQLTQIIGLIQPVLT